MSFDPISDPLGSDRRRSLDTSEDPNSSDVGNTTSFTYRAGVAVLHILPLGNYFMDPSNTIFQFLQFRRNTIQNTPTTMRVQWMQVEFIHRSCNE